MRTTAQDREFLDKVISDPNLSSLDDTIEWMQKRMKPEDVFTEKQLLNWAYEAGFEHS